MEDGAVEDSVDFSMEDPVCIDGVIFYGPMTDREKMVKERFERRQKEKAKTQFLPAPSNKESSGNVTKASEESKNDLNDISIYESFSIDESKYESFNDSLDERKLLNPNEINVSRFSPEQINVNKRRFQSKQMLKGSLCDSLEDIHSLVSNVEKLSISEEIENINILEKNNIYDDSLRNDVCLENKNFNPTDQNFDDDSLAILDYEKGFDDSLEEADILSLSHMDNVVILRSGENAEISVENLTKENTVTKNLFETSVEVIYENAGYVGNSEENAECPKQLSITADSLSISENISKDSLDGLPIIPKYLEQMTYKRNLSLLNRDRCDTSRSSPKLEYHGYVANMNDKDLKHSSEQNLTHNVNESVNQQFTNTQNNASSSNDTIVIEDSFIKSPDGTTSTKRENSVKSNEKDFSFPINDSFCKDDFSKESSFSTSNTNSVVNNHIKISDESINKGDIHPNDTICIDDSFISPQNISFIKDESHLVDIQIANQENISNDDLNYAIHTKNSVQPTLNRKNGKSIDKEKCSKKSIDSKFCVQNSIKHKLENLEIQIYQNDTICIDDSFNLPLDTLKKDELYSMKTQRSGSIKNTDQNLSSENNDTSNPKLNNSFTIPPQPMLNIKNEKRSSTLKKKKEKYFQGEDSISYVQSPPQPILNTKNDKSPSSLKRKNGKSSQKKDSISYNQSPVKHQLRHLENNNEVRVSNVNDTIYVSDSPVEPLKRKIEKKSPSSGNVSKMNSISPSQDKSINSKFNIQSPVKLELQHLEKKNETKVSDVNDTIYIDSSPSESLGIKVDKRSPFSGKGAKVSSPEFKNENVSNQKQFPSPQTAKVLYSPQETSKSNISDNIVKDAKNVIDYFKDALVLPKDLPKDSNLKLQLELVFDENQGVNIISVATVDQCTGDITPSVTKVDSGRIIVGKANQSADLSFKNKDAAVIIMNDEICESSVVSGKIISKDLSEVKSVVTKSYPEKNKSGSIFTDDQNDANGHNFQLLEALDLHDTSCSFIDNGFIQSRDSIMPLNLCIRSRSPETTYQYFPKTECKENIPLLDKQLVTAEDHSKNKRLSSTKASDKTPKQLNWNTDVKKSGSKTNSITKIPVRKIENPFFTPVHQKVSKNIKTGSQASSEKFFKNPLVKSISATDNLTAAKPLETPRRHHFCSVRNSISRVPKSTPRSIPKRFQNIESPIAKYIGKPQIYTPLKTTHRYDGNTIMGNAVKTNKHAIKTPNSACKGSPQCSSAGKL